MSWLQLLPQLVLYGFTSMLALVFALYILVRVRPATDEAVIGYYNFHLLNSGRKVKGLTSLAQRQISPIYTAILKEAVKEGILEASNPDGHLSDHLDGLYAYGVRAGLSKVLVLSKRDLQSPEYSQSEPGVKLSLHGWITVRHVYGYEVELDKPAKGWSRVVVLEPLNIQERKVEASSWEAMKAVGELAANLKAAATVLEKELRWRRIQRVYERRYGEAVDRLAVEVDRRLKAELEEAERGVAPRPEEIPSLLPRLSWWQWLTVAFAFYLGYQYGVPYLRPHYPNIQPLQAGFVFALLLYAAYFIYYKIWRSER